MARRSLKEKTSDQSTPIEFHLFTRLPAELRILIWTFTLESQVHTIQSNPTCYCRGDNHIAQVRRIKLRSTIPPSPLLSTNKESRVFYRSKHIFIPFSIPPGGSPGRCGVSSVGGFYFNPTLDVPYFPHKRLWRWNGESTHAPLILFAAALSSPYNKHALGSLPPKLGQIRRIAMNIGSWFRYMYDLSAPGSKSRPIGIYPGLKQLYIIKPESYGSTWERNVPMYRKFLEIVGHSVEVRLVLEPRVTIAVFNQYSFSKQEFDAKGPDLTILENIRWREEERLRLEAESDSD